MKRSPYLIFLVLLVLVSLPSSGFVPQIDINELDRIVSVAWPASEARSGLSYFVNTSSFPFNQADINRIVSSSFNAWDDVETADLAFSNGGSGNFVKSSTDRRNVVLYDPSGVEIGAPAGSGVIAITTINWDDQGRVTDADITFNGRDFDFSVTVALPRRGQSISRM